MFEAFSTTQVEQVYTINEKNFELTMNSLLSGEVPPQEEEILFRVEEDPN